MERTEGCMCGGLHCNGRHEPLFPRVPTPTGVPSWACTCGRPYWSVIPQLCPVHGGGGVTWTSATIEVGPRQTN